PAARLVDGREALAASQLPAYRRRLGLAREREAQRFPQTLLRHAVLFRGPIVESARDDRPGGRQEAGEAGNGVGDGDRLPRAIVVPPAAALVPQHVAPPRGLDEGARELRIA